jgi:hypothetical protein
VVIFTKNISMKLHIYLALLLMVILGACSKKEELPELSFDVSVESATVKVNEPVKFKFSGDPGTISFFSGESGSDYRFRQEPRIDNITEVTLSFQTHDQEATAPSLPAASPATFKVMFSTDFDGVYEYDHVNNATWEDISSRFIIAQPRAWGSNLGWFESGVVNISDLKLPGKPFYIAFKFDSPTGPAVASTRWRMSSFKLDLLTASGVRSNLGTYSNAKFKLVSRDNPITSRSDGWSASIMIFNPIAPANGTPQKPTIDEWGISPAYSADDINLGTDYATAIKGYGNPTVNDFSYTFSKEGVYKVVFIAANTNLYASQQIVKEVEIKVEP